MAEGSNNIVQWFGNYHLIFIHFPIALLLMAAVSEVICLITKNPKYEFTTKFLLIAGAFFCIPTIFSGLAMEEGGAFTQEDSPIFWWHRFFGISTLILSLLTIIIRAYSGRNAFYFLSFILLVICVLATAHFGGLLAFGPFNYLPSMK